jgi:hypothetical protein
MMPDTVCPANEKLVVLFQDTASRHCVNETCVLEHRAFHQHFFIGDLSPLEIGR